MTDEPTSNSDLPSRPGPPPPSRGVLLLMLFVALGPLAFPLLWRSPHFSKPWKAVLTVLVILALAAGLAIAYYVLKYRVVLPLREAFS